MTELQDALNRREKGDWSYADWGRIMDAARRVANPDIEAGTKRYIEKWIEITPRTNTRECFEAGLAVALGITTEDSE